MTVAFLKSLSVSHLQIGSECANLLFLLQTYFCHIFLLLISSWSLHHMCQRFLCCHIWK